jgi:multidrug efflux pump
MLLLGYSINLLTLLALVLAIGLVVDDAIIVVENVNRHISDGVAPYKAAILSVQELTKPIIAISIVLIAVYLPIGFMGGLTGALFTEFAFTLASAVGVSAVIALTLSPMMCSRMLKGEGKLWKGMALIQEGFDKFQEGYSKKIKGVMNYLPVVIVFAVVILLSNYFLFVTSKSELSPQEDQGILLTQSTLAGNASLQQNGMTVSQLTKIFNSFPQTQDTFQVMGSGGSNAAPALNTGFGGMNLIPWDKRKKSSNQLQPELQKKVASIANAKVAVFQPPSLPGGGAGMPVQFVLQSADNFNKINTVLNQMLPKIYETGDFVFINPDLKIDQLQTAININRDEASQFGLTMKDVGNSIAAALSGGYINYFNYMGYSYQVIPQMTLMARLNESDLLGYYVKTSSGMTLPLSTFVTLKHSVVPESINHFQQLNSTTISAVPAPGVSMGKALGDLKNIADQMLPQGYTINYAGQSRQYIQESDTLVMTFALALLIIYLCLSILFDSFRDPLVVLISVPMSICGAMIFISMGVGGATLNIYTEVGLVTLIGLISKHGILIVEFANDLQDQGVKKLEAAITAAKLRFRPILMTTAAMVLGVIPLIAATGAGAVSRFDIGLVIATGISIGTVFTLFVVPAMYLMIAENREPPEQTPTKQSAN